jgi:hypothetical protein
MNNLVYETIEDESKTNLWQGIYKGTYQNCPIAISSVYAEFSYRF